MAGVTYLTEDTFVSAKVQNLAPFAAGTYKRGQLVGRLTTNGKYTTYDAAGDDGSETIRAVVVNDAIVSSGGGYGAIARGEFIKEGVTAVMAGLGEPVAMNDSIVGQCWDAGIILN
jgi:hypothetical protein